MKKSVLPHTIRADNLVVVRGLDTGVVHCTSDRTPIADEWRKVHGALSAIEEQELLVKQPVVRP